MYRILRLKKTKFARQALLCNYGIGRVTAAKLIGIARLNPLSRADNLLRKRDWLDFRVKRLKIGFKLKLHVFKRILLTMQNKTYRGIRHIQHLPVRGQRTHTNAGTQIRLHYTGKYFPFQLRAKRIYITAKTKKLQALMRKQAKKGGAKNIKNIKIAKKPAKKKKMKQQKKK